MHVLVADDHDLVRDGLLALVHAQFKDLVISEAGSYAEVLAFAHRLPVPQLILLDLYMPGMTSDGFPGRDTLTGLQTIVRTFVGVPVLVVSALSDPETIAAALRQGAQGFVPKCSSSAVLGNAMRCVLAGEIFQPAVPILAPEFIGRSPAYTTIADPLEFVSPRESTVLKLVTQGLTNKEIALRLGLKEITVKVHLQHAYRKIGASNRADAVRIVLQSARPERAILER